MSVNLTMSSVQELRQKGLKGGSGERDTEHYTDAGTWKGGA